MKRIIKRIGVLFFCFLFCSLHISAQDTLSVYFKTGSSEIENAEKEKINLLNLHFELSELDSVQYIGMADSVGDFKSNKKLSEKRARVISKYCKSIFPEKIKISVSSRGEISKNKTADNRRVDILLFFKPKSTEFAEEKIVMNDSVKNCFLVDYYLLHRSSVRTISQKNKNMMLVEAPANAFRKFNNQFTAGYDKKGKLVLKKIKWNF
ncbi:MAG: OmpA family protein, partial [Bacteroidia bacterium]|nr:OmpA family protein [Bacteroidia bacterium]